MVHAYRRFEGSIGARRIPILRGVKRLKMKRKRNLKIGETGQPDTEGRGGDRATVATGTSDEAGRARRSRDLGDVNGVSREGPGSLDGWAVPAGNPAGAEAAVVRGVNVDRRTLARLSFPILDAPLRIDWSGELRRQNSYTPVHCSACLAFASVNHQGS